MSTTCTVSETLAPYEGIKLSYYPARLSDQQIEMLSVWATCCRLSEPRAVLLSSYISSLQSLERQRREAIASGAEVLEVYLPPVPTHCWSGPELAAALQKTTCIMLSTEGEVSVLFQKLNAACLAEAQWRLGLRD